MPTYDEMLKEIILAGRDEGFMEPGDNVSATGEVLVIFGGYDLIYDEDKDEEAEDENNEIYEIYINANALEEGFEYLEPEQLMGLDVSQENQIYMRVVYEVDKDYIHSNLIEDYVKEVDGLSIDKIGEVIKVAYESVSE